MRKLIFVILFQLIIFNCKAFVIPNSSADSVIVENVAFVKLGSYREFNDDGSEYQKSYFLSRYMRNNWGEAKAICAAFKFELTTLETLTEAQHFLTMADSSSLRTWNTANLFIDGMTLTPKSTTDWYWTDSGKKIPFPIQWQTGQPDNNNNSELCFSIFKNNMAQKFGYNDYNCLTDNNFICQKVELYIPKSIGN